MTITQAIEAMSDLSKATEGLQFPGCDVFRMTTQLILSGLRQPTPDESLIKDAVEHFEQAKRLIGEQI
jgi:hypothetical protein